MNLKIGKLLGDGAYSDVYAAEDEIGRSVAVKIIRPDRDADEIALGHAKILAKADHQNIVRVLSVENIDDPVDPSRRVQAIVMEQVEGETLFGLLLQDRLDLSVARKIGLEVMDALLHLHEKGVAHGDLHTENIMVANGSVKLIDLLYIANGSHLTTRSFEERVRRDILSARLVLQELLQQVKEPPGLAKSFNDSLDIIVNALSLRASFDQKTNGAIASDSSEAVSYGLQLILDEAFVEGDEYAEAVLETLPIATAPHLLLALIEGGHVRSAHRSIVRMLYAKCSQETRKRISELLSSFLTAEIPNGNWVNHLRALLYLGADGWEALTPLCRLRLENAIVKDTLNGRVDLYSPVRVRGGSLGTWANSLYPRFRDRDALVVALVGLLEQNWYTQNYVADYFMSALPNIASTEEHRRSLISALRSAIQNDAKVVKQKLAALPREWQEAVRAR